MILSSIVAAAAAAAAAVRLQWRKSKDVEGDYFLRVGVYHQILHDKRWMFKKVTNLADNLNDEGSSTSHQLAIEWRARQEKTIWH